MGFWGPERQWSSEGRKRSSMAQYDRISGDVGKQAGTANDEYLSRALAFDPSESVTQFGQGFMDEAMEGLGENFESLAGASVGSGRMNTGFMQKDQKGLFQDFNRRVTNAIAAQSMNAAGLQQQNIQGLGAYGSDMRQQQIDLLGGAMDRSTSEDNSRMSPANFVSSLAGAGAGMYTGFSGGGGPDQNAGRDQRAGARRRRAAGR